MVNETEAVALPAAADPLVGPDRHPAVDMTQWQHERAQSHMP